MPIDWLHYDEFDWDGSQQHPLADRERAGIEDFVAETLQLADSDRCCCWGHASPPGRYAATVIHVSPETNHSFSQQADELQVDRIGVKVFKQTPDALREARRVIPFHQQGLVRLPGLPNPFLQKTLHAEIRLDSRGEERPCIIQEWMEGETLEQLHRRQWAQVPVTGIMVRSILQQLLGGIVIPLWSCGLIWWDFRDANFCYDAKTDRLSLIDVDSLGAYAAEMLKTPHVWTRRDRGRLTALARLRQMCVRLIGALRVRGKREIATRFNAAWRDDLEPALLRLGKSEESRDEAELALAQFLNQIANLGLIDS